MKRNKSKTRLVGIWKSAKTGLTYKLFNCVDYCKIKDKSLCLPFSPDLFNSLVSGVVIYD